MTTKLHRGAYFGDIHFGRKANSIVHNQDCINYITWFCEQVQENNCDYICFLGDWNENRSALNIHTLKYTYEGAKMIDNLGLPVYFLLGNHDLYYRNSRDVHSVIHFDEFKNFNIIDTPTVVEDILFCPYLFHEEYPSLSDYLDVPFWAGHFEFKGFIITGYNITMPTGPDASNFRKPDHIVSGHFHKRQIRDNVVYIGNTFPMDFGDAGDTERGMMVYDHHEDSMWFENWDACPRYTKVLLSDLVEDRDTRKQVLVPNARVKCLVDIQIDFDESNYLQQKFTDDYHLREFTLEETPELRTVLSETETDINWDETSLETVDDLVIHMLQGISSDRVDNNLLIDLYKDIKTND